MQSRNVVFLMTILSDKIFECYEYNTSINATDGNWKT